MPRLSNIWERAAIAVVVAYISLLTYLGKDVLAQVKDNTMELARREAVIRRAEQVPDNAMAIEVIKTDLGHIKEEQSDMDKKLDAILVKLEERE